MGCAVGRGCVAWLVFVYARVLGDEYKRHLSDGGGVAQSARDAGGEGQSASAAELSRFLELDCAHVDDASVSIQK